MTKKTDSLIFRYGIQTLWKNTNFLFKTSVSNSFFFNFIQFELQQRNFELLCIEQKKTNIIYAFVFCFFWKNTTSLLKQTNTVLLFKVVSFYKYWFLVQILYSLFSILNSKKLKLLNIDFLFYCRSNISFLTYKQDYNYTLNYTNLDTLFFKVEQVRLEHYISLYFERPFFIKLQNIFNLPLYFDFIQLSKYLEPVAKRELTTLEFLLYLSCKLRTAGIFARYLARSLALEKRHKRLLRQVVNAVKLLDSNLSLFKGIRIYITGKLNGKMRRKTYSYQCGKLAMQEIHTNLDYFKAISFTKFGTISIKVWFFF